MALSQSSEFIAEFCLPSLDPVLVLAVHPPRCFRGKPFFEESDASVKCPVLEGRIVLLEVGGDADGRLADLLPAYVKNPGLPDSPFEVVQELTESAASSNRVLIRPKAR